jgi:hypothetical protein
MVQVHTSEPTDAEWTKMLQHMVARKDTLKAVLAVGHGEAGPTSKQRAQLAETLKRIPRKLSFALITNSRVARGVMTAINWLTKKHAQSQAFPLDGLEQAMVFLRIEDREKAEVRLLVFKLGGLTAPARSAVS